MKIYKFRLKEGGEITEIEGAHKVLHFTYQDGYPYIWVEYDPHSLFTRSIFAKVVMTGEDAPPGYQHFMTAMEGWFVGHLYVRDVKNT